MLDAGIPMPAQLWEIYTERGLYFFAVILFYSTPSPAYGHRQPFNSFTERRKSKRCGHSGLVDLMGNGAWSNIYDRHGPFPK
jgi:hypothetical protein